MSYLFDNFRTLSENNKKNSRLLRKTSLKSFKIFWKSVGIPKQFGLHRTDFDLLHHLGASITIHFAILGLVFLS